MGNLNYRETQRFAPILEWSRTLRSWVGDPKPQHSLPHPELGMLFAIDQAADHANDEINRLLIVKSLPANE